jgi:transposase, IS30 family
MSTYTQLNQEERYQIHALMKEGYSQTEIASVLGRDKSTISRELKRNQGQRGYRPKQAWELADRRRQTAHRAGISTAHWGRVEALLRQDWSPEQVSGWLDHEEGIAVSPDKSFFGINPPVALAS